MRHDADNLLREWADRQAPDPARLAALEARIVSACRSCQPLDGQAASRGRTRTLRFDAHHRQYLLYVVAGLAAAVLAILLYEVLAVGRHGLAPLLREENRLFAGQRPGMARVFGETERLFGPNLQWVAQSGCRGDLSVAATPGADGQAMVVRLAVLRRDDGTPWRRLWVADIVARPDDLVEWSPDGLPGNRVSLWMHRLDSGAALLESSLDLQAPMKMQAETSEVLRFGAAATAARVRRGDVEFLLLQTLAPAGGVPCAS